MANAELTYQLAINLDPSQTQVFDTKDIFISGYKYGIRGYLDQRKLWQEKPGGSCLFYALDNPSQIIKFDPEGFEFQDRLFMSLLTPRSKFSGLIIASEKPIDKDGVNILEGSLSKLTKNLRKESPIFLFENEVLVGQDEILEVFRQDNLVKVNFLKSLHLLESRVEKPKKSIDITSIEHPKLRDWAIRNWKIMEKVYFDEGYKLIDRNNSQIVERLKDSYNVKVDLNRLIEGLGVSLMARCGCKWNVDLKGNWERIERCPDEDCDGIPQVVSKYEDGKKIISKDICFDCGNNLEKVFMIDGTNNKIAGKRSLIKYELRCPSCGLIGVKKQIVSNCLIKD